MKKSEVVRAWTSILAGRASSLSIEITKEYPLLCPGCYASDPAHSGGTFSSVSSLILGARRWWQRCWQLSMNTSDCMSRLSAPWASQRRVTIGFLAH
jgi:hypothetical protein